MLEKIKSLPSRIIPSFQSLFRRFPIPTILIVLEFIGLIILTQYDAFKEQETYVFGIALLGNYILTMFSIALHLFFEKTPATKLQKIMAFSSLIIVVILAVVFIEYKDVASYEILGGAQTGNTYKLEILMVLATASSFILPFIKEKDSKEWWNFTLTTASRAVISSLYSVAIYAGVGIAFFAIQSFWNVQFYDNLYPHLAFLCFVLILPLHFLNGLYDLTKTQKLIELPKFLMILVKYILTPLIAIYTLILYPYIFSFPFKAEWPSNVATGVILALLAMIYIGIIMLYGANAKDENEQKFKRLYIKITSIVALPTIVFWAYSLSLRINAYGITIDRFVLMAIIFWFAFMSILYILRPNTNAKYLLGSLFILIATIIYLPFTAYFWSEKSQIQRLINIAKEEDIYKNNVIVKGEKAKVDSHYNDMNETLAYIHNNLGLNGLKAHLSQDIIESMDIDKYGYSSLIDNYSYSTLTFFFTTPPANKYHDYVSINILLDQKEIQIPNGYNKLKYYDDISSYMSNGASLTNNEITIGNHKFDVKNIALKDTELHNSPTNLDTTVYRDSSNKYLSNVEKLTLHSKTDDSIFVISKISFSNSKGQEELEATYVYGYLFTK